MITVTRDERDRVTDNVHRFLLKAAEDKATADPISGLLGVDPLPRDDWPRPGDDASYLALLAVQEAVPCVKRGARTLGLTSLRSESAAVPSPRLEFLPELPEKIVACAPLVFECLDGDAIFEFTELAAYRFSSHTKKLFHKDILLNQSRRLNVYLGLEANLWWLAREGGFRGDVPYAIRYESARWLWDPQLPDAVVFCLRCGVQVRYKRAPRRRAVRWARCDACSRGPVDDWPTDAIAPARRGTWWLRCKYEGCAFPLEGTQRAKWCPQHKASRLTASKRPTRAPDARGLGAAPPSRTPEQPTGRQG